ncbi:MAG: M20/M25/M40 family metallo-hydrolase [Pseudomonadota bacterium]
MKALTDALAPITGQRENMVDRTTQWANINSGSGHVAGNIEVAKAIAPVFRDLGMAQTEFAAADEISIDDQGKGRKVPRAPGLLFSLRPQTERRIVLAGHLDTVFPPDHPFQNVDRRKNGELHGPGCADMKGGIAVMAEAIRCFEASQYAPDVGINVVLNSDEENGSYASAHAFEQVAKRADVGLIFEPCLPDGSLAGARSGSGHYSFTIRGRAAHAGRSFHEGRNAITAAAKVIAALDSLNGNALGIPIKWAPTGGVCDGNNLAANGVPNVDTLGVRGAFIHSSDEYAVIDSFEERARLAALIMLMLAGGEAPWPDRLSSKGTPSC